MSYEKLYTYLGELLQSYTRLSELLKEKLDAVSRFDIEKLDDIMKQEQVFVLQSKGFDAHIASLRDSLSLKGDKLSEIINELPEQEQARFLILHKNLKATLEEVRGLNERCQVLIGDRLHSLDRAIRELDPADAQAYSKGGERPSGKPESGLFTKSV